MSLSSSPPILARGAVYKRKQSRATGSACGASEEPHSGNRRAVDCTEARSTAGCAGPGQPASPREDTSAVHDRDSSGPDRSASSLQARRDYLPYVAEENRKEGGRHAGGGRTKARDRSSGGGSRGAARRSRKKAGTRAEICPQTEPRLGAAPRYGRAGAVRDASVPLINKRKRSDESK